MNHILSDLSQLGYCSALTNCECTTFGTSTYFCYSKHEAKKYRKNYKTKNRLNESHSSQTFTNTNFPIYCCHVVSYISSQPQTKLPKMLPFLPGAPRSKRNKQRTRNDLHLSGQ